MPKAATQQKKKSIYGVHPGVAMTQKWVAELKQKTGRTVLRSLNFRAMPHQENPRPSLKELKQQT